MRNSDKPAVMLAALGLIGAIAMAAPAGAQTTTPDQGQGDSAGQGKSDDGSGQPASGQHPHSGHHGHHHRKPDQGDSGTDGGAQPGDAPPKG